MTNTTRVWRFLLTVGLILATGIALMRYVAAPLWPALEHFPARLTLWAVAAVPSVLVVDWLFWLAGCRRPAERQGGLTRCGAIRRGALFPQEGDDSSLVQGRRRAGLQRPELERQRLRLVAFGSGQGSRAGLLRSDSDRRQRQQERLHLPGVVQG